MKAGCDQICKKERWTKEKELFFAKTVFIAHIS